MTKLRKTLNVKNITKLKNSNCDKTQKLKLWQNSKTWIVTKLKKSNCDKNQKLKWGQNSKTEFATKLKNWNCDQTQKLKLQQYQNCKKTWKLIMWQTFLFCYTIVCKNKLTHWQPRDVFRAAFRDTHDVFVCISDMQGLILWLGQKGSFYDPGYLQFDKIRLLV